MKKHLLGILLCAGLVSAKAQTSYPHLNVELLAHLDPETDNTGQEGRKYSGCWGWYQAAKDKEYALIGTSTGTYFIDVTNPVYPSIKDYVPGKHAGCTWREIKTYQNYCYVVSDDAPPNSFQIIDMQYLPDSVHVVYDGTDLFERCHTIWVDGNKLYCGGPTPLGTFTQNMQVYSLANPEAPVLLRTLSDDFANIGYVHDMLVVNDTIYASCANQGLFIFKFDTVTNTFSALASFTGYYQAGYNHSSALTEDRKTLVFCDEVPANLVVKIIDVSNFNNITLTDTVRSNYGDTPHNPYIIGNQWAWVSSYQDGLYLYDISNPSNVTMAGFFDTYPQHGLNDGYNVASAYSGNWGAYPFLPSKLIIANDMQNGIFLLQANAIYGTSTGINDPAAPAKTSIYPNPAKGQLMISYANNAKESLHYTISDLLGHVVQSGTIEEHGEMLVKANVNVSTLANGCYMLTTQGSNWKETHKVLIAN